MKVCVVGLGQVGLPVAQYAFSRGLEVWGYDISLNTVEKAGKTEKFKVTGSWEDVPAVDVYVVCVTTSQRDGCPDLSPVFDVCKMISGKAKPSSLASVERMITRGTCRKIFEDIYKKRVNVVHAPHRYWAGDPVKHGVNQLRVIGGVNAESLSAGVKFYGDSLGIPMHVASSVEVAEMCKISENSHRYLQIAFSEELKMICAKIGLNFDEVREEIGRASCR